MSLRGVDCAWLLIRATRWLSDRIPSQPNLPGGRASGPGVSGLDRPQPRAIGPEDHQDDPGIPASSEISPNQAIGRVRSQLARLRIVDALYGSEPETPADQQRCREQKRLRRAFSLTD